MTYDSAAWTGRYPATHFPHFLFAFVCPWFGVRIGPMFNQDAYGIAVSWGYVPPAPFVATHRHYWSRVWVTSYELLSRAHG